MYKLRLLNVMISVFLPPLPFFVTYELIGFFDVFSVPVFVRMLASAFLFFILAS